MPGLIRKYYLYGDDGVAGGAYLWESREAAEAVYTAEWREMIAARYGSEPMVTYFETPLVVDNVSGDVIGEAADCWIGHTFGTEGPCDNSRRRRQ